MNYEDIKLWCHNEMRAHAESDIYRRAKTILVAVEAASAPTWLSDAAEALGMVRPDGAPMALNWTQVIQHIRELREDRDTLLSAVLLLLARSTAAGPGKSGAPHD